MIALGKSHPLTRALTALGERWTLRILGEVFRGRGRFEELEASLGIPPTTLSKRLKHLVHEGVLERRYERSMTKPTYHLTPKGNALLPALVALNEWAEEWWTVGGKTDNRTVLADSVTSEGIVFSQLPRSDGTNIGQEGLEAK